MGGAGPCLKALDADESDGFFCAIGVERDVVDISTMALGVENDVARAPVVQHDRMLVISANSHQARPIRRKPTGRQRFELR